MFGFASYLVIISACVAGLIGLSPTLTIASAAVALTSLSAIEHSATYSRACALTATRGAAWITLLLSLRNGLVASAAAYGLGFVLGLAA